MILDQGEVFAPDGWAEVGGSLATRIHLDTYKDGVSLVSLIGRAADAADHHPTMTLGYDYLDVSVTTHDAAPENTAGQVTLKDTRFALRVSDLAAQRGLTVRYVAPEPQNPA